MPEKKALAGSIFSCAFFVMADELDASAVRGKITLVRIKA